MLFKDTLAKFLENFNYDSVLSYSSCFLLVGNTFTGKTSSVKQLIKDYDVKELNDCYSAREMRENIIKTLKTKLLEDITFNVKKKVILIDNLDVISSLDNTVFGTLHKLLESNICHNAPIIGIITLHKYFHISNTFIELSKKVKTEYTDTIELVKYIDPNILYFQTLPEYLKKNVLSCFKNQLLNYFYTLRAYMKYDKLYEYDKEIANNFLDVVKMLKYDKRSTGYLRIRKNEIEIKHIPQNKKKNKNKKHDYYPFNELSGYYLTRYFLTTK